MEPYRADAVLLAFESTVRGRAERRPYLAAYPVRLGTPRPRSTDQFATNEGAILVEGTVVADHGAARVHDAFALREGKATHHVGGEPSFRPDAG